MLTECSILCYRVWQHERARFNSIHLGKAFAPLAQLAEQLTLNQTPSEAKTMKLRNTLPNFEHHKLCAFSNTCWVAGPMGESLRRRGGGGRGARTTFEFDPPSGSEQKPGSAPRLATHRRKSGSRLGSESNPRASVGNRFGRSQCW